MKKGSEEVKLSEDSNFLDLKKYLKNRNIIFTEIFDDRSVKFFLNLEEINDLNVRLKDGDEVAFLPPVTGG